ncbi:hypothetical protein vBAbaMPhT2_061 [Acinetobacter phage vB_AbaM_PhT2]|uniref:Uncharacterized protein n=1 Tax=Acinetobacter phage vB_AbaM_PhT2 TaxID=2690230 RepID=A0A6B9T0G4_9CAUD|nr:hypothetical protein HYQ24_gp061 [Acinetobacter phage vB_AbaM_PhT2]QHJ75673.1 hypothetical protein vBAbaMPhT2_061 [Acinetobacter phage vB_AbaM_PhT2]QQM13756.1 hypothetical protein CPT_Maestro_022 [Acinetobacter phage Maestro]QQM18513.1 hypothetical protein CPT_Morttis_020 [Acinetobacter phage Morttis]
MIYVLFVILVLFIILAYRFINYRVKNKFGAFK